MLPFKLTMEQFHIIEDYSVFFSLIYTPKIDRAIEEYI